MQPPLKQEGSQAPKYHSEPVQLKNAQQMAPAVDGSSLNAKSDTPSEERGALADGEAFDLMALLADDSVHSESMTGNGVGGAGASDGPDEPVLPTAMHVQSSAGAVGTLETLETPPSAQGLDWRAAASQGKAM